MQAAQMSTQLKRLDAKQVAWLVKAVQICQLVKKVIISRYTMFISLAVLVIALAWRFSQ